MKKIFCVERWLSETEPSRDGWFYGNEWWKIGKFSFIEEYEDEERFKETLTRMIDSGEIVSSVFIKMEPDNYKPRITL